MHYIISSLANGQDFHLYGEIRAEDSRNGMSPPILKTVRIKGGAGLADKALHTPHGVVTPVTDEELEALQKIPAFVSFEKSGHLVVEKSDSEPSGDKFATEMGTDRGSQPLSPASYKDKDASAPEVLSVTDNTSSKKGRGRQGA
jgi:hypothetical protein